MTPYLGLFFPLQPPLAFLSRSGVSLSEYQNFGKRTAEAFDQYRYLRDTFAVHKF
jgi:hypothetical protein